MRKLMSANLARLWRDRVFWIGMLAMAAYSVLSMVNGCRQAARDMSEFGYTLEHYYFQGMPVIGIFIAVFTGLFLGTEYSDGTLRNKLIVGHTRAQVYLSNLLTTTTASLLMLAVWFIGGLVGIPALGAWRMGASNLLIYFGISSLMVAALSAIFALTGMLLTNRAIAAVVSILICLGIVLSGSMLYNALSEPEMSSGMIVTQNGVAMGEPTPNPDYVGGAKRAAYEFMVDFIPAGQGILLADLAVARPARMMLSSAAIIALFTLCGLLTFGRKDLK